MLRCDQRDVGEEEASLEVVTVPLPRAGSIFILSPIEHNLQLIPFGADDLSHGRERC